MSLRVKHLSQHRARSRNAPDAGRGQIAHPGPLPPMQPIPASIAARRLILASSSPYRRALLERLRVTFDVDVPAIDETPLPHEAPAGTALRLAEAKARAVAARSGDALVIGSDQVATLAGRQIGKPGDHARARAAMRDARARRRVSHRAVPL
ncbi:Septum formation protein Maf [Mycetohabitans rhizoxinica HKI 454]|uniref:Septum formation protein Maf n=1 Tax=Mycetohabitans rhizoxinica (strain DSM 19002 / CIP 109453 / HKI 454) TaxID=882378 RepID=E5ANX0_MYCRK|nr:Septum formation protein Maf [Mycetohabitans rhizoxinica HKI 454]